MKTRTKGSEGKRCEECCGQEKKVRPRFFVQTFFFLFFLKKNTAESSTNVCVSARRDVVNDRDQLTETVDSPGH